MTDLEREEHCRRLQLNWVNLLNLMDTRCGLIEQLYQEQVLTFVEMSHIQETMNMTKRNGQLLDILYTHSGDEFDRFVAALDATGQHAIANMLRFNGIIVRLHVTGLSYDDECHFLTQLKTDVASSNVDIQRLDLINSELQKLRIRWVHQVTSGLEFYLACSTVKQADEICIRFWSGHVSQTLPGVFAMVLPKKDVEIKVSMPLAESCHVKKENETKWEWLLSSWRETLVELLYPNSSKLGYSLLDLLWNKDVLSHDAIKKLLERTYQEKNKAMLEVITSEEKFQHLLSALESSEQWFALHLLGGAPTATDVDINCSDTTGITSSDSDHDTDECFTIEVIDFLLDKTVKVEGILKDKTTSIEDLICFVESGDITDDKLKELLWPAGKPPCGQIITMMPGNIWRWQPSKWHIRLQPELMVYYLLALSAAMRKHQHSEVERLIFSFCSDDERRLHSTADQLSGLDIRQIRALIRINLKHCSDRYSDVKYNTVTSSRSESFAVFFPLNSNTDPNGRLRQWLDVNRNLHSWTSSSSPPEERDLPSQLHHSGVTRIKVPDNLFHPKIEELQVLKEWLALAAPKCFSEFCVFPTSGNLDLNPRDEWNGLIGELSNSVINDPMDSPFRGLLAIFHLPDNDPPIVSYAEYVRRAIPALIRKSQGRLRCPTATICAVIEVGSRVGLNKPNDFMCYCDAGTVWQAYCGRDPTSCCPVSYAAICVQL